MVYVIIKAKGDGLEWTITYGSEVSLADLSKASAALDIVKQEIMQKILACFEAASIDKYGDDKLQI